MWVPNLPEGSEGVGLVPPTRRNASETVFLLVGGHGCICCRRVVGRFPCHAQELFGRQGRGCSGLYRSRGWVFRISVGGRCACGPAFSARVPLLASSSSLFGLYLHPVSEPVSGLGCGLGAAGVSQSSCCDVAWSVWRQLLSGCPESVTGFRVGGFTCGGKLSGLPHAFCSVVCRVYVCCPNGFPFRIGQLRVGCTVRLAREGPKLGACGRGLLLWLHMFPTETPIYVCTYVCSVEQCPPLRHIGLKDELARRVRGLQPLNLDLWNRV